MPERVELEVYVQGAGWWTEVGGFADQGPYGTRDDAYRAALELVLAAKATGAVITPLLQQKLIEGRQPADAPAVNPVEKRTLLRYFEKMAPDARSG